MSSLSNTPGGGLIVLASIALSWWIWSVWTWRYALKTSFRGGTAQSLLGEFKTYGYSQKVFKLVGVVKLASATLLAPISVLYVRDYVLSLAAAILVVLMTVAIVSHLRVGDPPMKNLPAA